MEKNGCYYGQQLALKYLAVMQLAFREIFFVKSAFHFSCQTVLSQKFLLRFPITPFRRVEQLLVC